MSNPLAARAVPPRRGARVLRHAVAVWACLALACAPDEPRDGTAPAAGSRPDLLLIVVDTLRADRLSAYGYPRPTSPQLDALAAQGVLFSDVTAQSSWTLPSMASMLTGRHMFVNARRLPQAVPSLAERLKAAGYQTAAFVGNFAVGRSGGFDRGFDHFINRDQTGGTTWDAGDLEAAVEDWLTLHPPGDAPRFLYLHYLDPHYPYAPDAPASLEGEPRLRDDTLEAWVETTRGHEPARRHFDRDRRSILEDLDAYDREVAAVDASIGRLLARLGTRDLLVVVAADHGEVLWDHLHHDKVMREELRRAGRDPDEAGLRDLFFRDHSYHMFQELLATPLIVAGPGLPAGLRSATPVENVDIVPTLLAAAGLPDDPALDGHALQDVLAGDVERPFIYAHAKEATVVRRTADGRKLIFPTETGDWFEMPIQVFDLAADPHERRNLASQDLDALRALVRERELAAKAFDLFDGEDAEATSAELQADLAEMGYLGSGFAVPATGEEDEDRAR